MKEYVWIHLCYDKAGLFTAELKVNNDVVDTLGGSYPRFVAARFDAWNKWGNTLPVHGNGHVISNENDLVEELPDAKC
jgi:hypothetical protein